MNPTPRILVVDDDPEGCGTLVALLTAVFPETEQARDAEEALARLRTQVYDIVLANVSIKGVRGTELLQRALESKCDAGFILLADKPEPEDFAGGIRHRAMDFLVKPFPPTAVVEAVHNAYREVAGQREQRELLKKLEDGLAQRTNELDHAIQHLQGTYRATLEALVMALDAREHDTSTHSFRVRAYSSSQVDKRRVGQLALAIQVAFQEMGVFQDSNTHVPIANTDDMPFQKAQIIENVDRTQQMQRFVQPMSGILSNTAPTEAVKDIQHELEKALGPEIQQHFVEMRTTREGLVVSLREIGFFDSGSATLRPSSEDAIDRLVSVLRNRPEMLRIEGHTDNVPIHTARFASNWELSTARATEVIRGFIDRYHLPPERLAAAGYGEHHPVASNDTAEGRARNRRVDIVILAPPVSYLPSPKLTP